MRFEISSCRGPFSVDLGVLAFIQNVPLLKIRITEQPCARYAQGPSLCNETLQAEKLMSASQSLRRGILLIFVLGTVGLGTELWLLGHFAEWRQQVPLALLALGLVLLAMRMRYRGAIVLRLFRLTMLAFVLGGMVGLWFHLSANMEFELEMYPTLSGLELLFKSLGGAMPVLAPGALVQLGLIGLLYTYQHPSLTPKRTKEN